MNEEEEKPRLKEARLAYRLHDMIRPDKSAEAAEEHVKRSLYGRLNEHCKECIHCTLHKEKNHRDMSVDYTLTCAEGALVTCPDVLETHISARMTESFEEISRQAVFGRETAKTALKEVEVEYPGWLKGGPEEVKVIKSEPLSESMDGFGSW